MDQKSAVALANYLNRAVGIVPTTLAEAEQMQVAFAFIGDVANGRVSTVVPPTGEQAEEAQPPPG